MLIILVLFWREHSHKVFFMLSLFLKTILSFEITMVKTKTELAQHRLRRKLCLNFMDFSLRAR